MNWLLDTTHFITRNNCGDHAGWSQQLIAIYQLANLTIAIAYFSLPIGILGLWYKLKEFKLTINNKTWVILLFGLFILSCGLGHLMDVISFYYVPYRLFVLIDCITAIFSIFTAIIFPPVVFDIIRLAKDKKNEGYKE